MAAKQAVNDRKNNNKGLYLPSQVKILDVVGLSPDTRLFRLERPKGFSYKPGQFVMASVWGAGEVPISITSTYDIHREIELCIRKVGSVTSALHQLEAGNYLGIRGPFGNGFNTGEAEGRDVLFVAGGIGIAPLRSLINLVAHRKEKFGAVALIYGSRNPSEVLFMDEILGWKAKGADITLTVEARDKGWEYNTGLVTEHFNKPKISFKKCRSYICGPHVMINAAMRDLSLMGAPAENIVTTLEAHMKCGVGKCGHCYADGKYICTDGPVFTFKEIKQYNLNSP